MDSKKTTIDIDFQSVFRNHDTLGDFDEQTIKDALQTETAGRPVTIQSVEHTSGETIIEMDIDGSWKSLAFPHFVPADLLVDTFSKSIREG